MGRAQSASDRFANVVGARRGIEREEDKEANSFDAGGHEYGLPVFLTALDSTQFIIISKALRATAPLSLQEAKNVIDRVRSGQMVRVNVQNEACVDELRAVAFKVKLVNVRDSS